DPAALNAIATAGGTALAGTTKYYQADNAAALQAAFAAIAGKVLSCSYKLSMAPPDPNLLYVYFDGILTPRDLEHKNGCDYNATGQQLGFYGPACLSLQQGLVPNLTISYGCVQAQTSSSSGGDGGPCAFEGQSCTIAADCCGGLDCLQGLCQFPIPK